MYANTLFMCVCFEPRGCQLLTGGTDRRVAYWEAGSGNLAREVPTYSPSVTPDMLTAPVAKMVKLL